MIAYIEFWRNTPIVAQLFFLYFALPLINIKVSAFNCGLIALVLHFNAYNIEVFRAGIEAVPSGLEEASKALAMNYFQRLRLVTLPLALRLSLPALVNNYVSLLKNTALVSVIGVVELTFVAQDIIADNFTFKEMYSTVALLYLVLVFGLTWILRKIERRYAIEMI
jgi:polar amino acid transport system permease protein